MPFDGKRVVAFESRRAPEIAELIRRQGGQPFVAPAMREVPLGEDDALRQFAEALRQGAFDMVILLTGVGTRQLVRAVPDLMEGLKRVTIVARGPKPAAALREMGVSAAIVAPEPNTWREVLASIEGRPERRIAVQEYGRSNPELLAALRARGAEVTPVRVYRYGMPDDPKPLREAARRLAAGQFEVALFTTGTQIEHLMQAAAAQGMEKAVLAGLQRCRVCSIGPTTTEALEEFGIRPAMEPSHPKMGILVSEAAAQAE